MQFPIAIDLHRSRGLFLLLALVHGLAAGCVLALAWPLPLRCLLVALVGVSLLCALRQSRIRTLWLCADARIDAVLADGRRVSLTLQPDTTVFRRMIVLRARIGDEKRVSSLALLSDHMSAEQFRILRLWLRWRSDARDGAPPAS